MKKQLCEFVTLIGVGKTGAHLNFLFLTIIFTYVVFYKLHDI